MGTVTPRLDKNEGFLKKTYLFLKKFHKALERDEGLALLRKKTYSKGGFGGRLLRVGSQVFRGGDN